MSGPAQDSVPQTSKALPDSIKAGTRFRAALIYCFIVFAISWSFVIGAAIVDDADWHYSLGFFHLNVTRRGELTVLAGLSPALTALLLGTVTRWRLFPNPYSQLRSPIRPKFLYLLSIFTPMLLVYLILFVEENFSPNVFLGLGAGTLVTFFWTFLVNLPLASFGEEPGWRGCLLPLLTPQFGLWGASLIVGVIWAVWHLASDLLLNGYSLNNFLIKCLAVIGMSVVLAALYKAGGNSLRLPMLFHAGWNAMSRSVVEIDPNFGLRALSFLAIATWVLAAFCWLWWSKQESTSDQRLER